VNWGSETEARLYSKSGSSSGIKEVPELSRNCGGAEPGFEMTAKTR